MNELQILDAVSRHGGSIPYTRLMSVGMSCTDWSPAADKQLILDLIHADVLSGHPGAYQTIRFGPRGEMLLRDLRRESSIRAENIRAEQEQQNDRHRKMVADHADRKAERRADRIFQIFLSFLSSLLPLLLPPLLAAFRDLLTVIVEFLTH